MSVVSTELLHSRQVPLRQGFLSLQLDDRGELYEVSN